MKMALLFQLNLQANPLLITTVWATFKNTIILFVCPPKFCMNIVSIFPLDLQWSQEKIKTMLMQDFGGQTKSIMVFLKVAYRDQANGSIPWKMTL